MGSEAPHDDRDIRSVGGQHSDTRPDDIELAEETKESEVINRKSNLDGEVAKFPNKSYSDAKREAKSYISAKSGAGEVTRPPAKFYRITKSSPTDSPRTLVFGIKS